MIKLNYIINNWDRFYVSIGDRLCQFLTNEQEKFVGWEIKEPNMIHKEFTKQNVINLLKEDVEFGFKMALSKRGFSAGAMYENVKDWLFILEDPLKDFNNYPMYGLPLFKAVAIKYGFNNPIGKDTGSEEKYS